MATETQKKSRQLQLFNTIISGQAKGLYDLFGDSAQSVIGPIGQEILEEMEREMGLEINGENANTILTDVGRILVDEYGLLSDFQVKRLEGVRTQIICRDCLLKSASLRLKEAGVPVACIPHSLARAALRYRLGSKSHLIDIQIGERECIITGETAEAG